MAQKSEEHIEGSAVLSAATEQERQSGKNITAEIAENTELSQIC